MVAARGGWRERETERPALRKRGVRLKKASRWLFSIPVLSLAIWGLWAQAQEADSDGDGLPDSWETRYSLNPASPADAALDADGDGLNNLAEYTADTDPQRPDTDRDGWSDSLDQVPLSRAFGHLAEGRFVSGDLFSYPAPAWFEGAVRSGGDWTTNGWAATTNDALLLDLDRATLTNNLALALVHTGAALHADLLDANDTVLAEAVLTLPAGSAPANVPLSAYPAAVTLRLRASGALALQSYSLYRDDDLDGLDAEQEAQLGTSDQTPDSDQDGFRDLYELQTGHDPLDAQNQPATALTLMVPPDATVEFNASTDPTATGQAVAYQNDGLPVTVSHSDLLLETGSELPPRASPQFSWLYEMTLAPNNQNLDNAGGDDWYDTAAPAVAGGLATGGAGLFFRGDYMGSIWRLGLTNGNYTVEFSANVRTNGTEGAMGSLGFFGEKPSDANQGLRLNVKRHGQTVSNGSTVQQTLGEQDNTDVFHAFRVARVASGRYELWRDGKRLTTAPLAGTNNGNDDGAFLGAFSSSLSGGCRRKTHWEDGTMERALASICCATIATFTCLDQHAESAPALSDIESYFRNDEDRNMYPDVREWLAHAPAGEVAQALTNLVLNTTHGDVYLFALPTMKHRNISFKPYREFILTLLERYGGFYLLPYCKEALLPEDYSYMLDVMMKNAHDEAYGEELDAAKLVARYGDRTALEKLKSIHQAMITEEPARVERLRLYVEKHPKWRNAYNRDDDIRYGRRLIDNIAKEIAYMEARLSGLLLWPIPEFSQKTRESLSSGREVVAERKGFAERWEAPWLAGGIVLLVAGMIAARYIAVRRREK